MISASRKKKKRTQTRNIWLILVSVGGLLFVCAGVTVFAFGIVLQDAFLSDTTTYLTDDEAIAVVERTLGASLPSSASSLHYIYTGWLDHFLRIRVEMPPQDVLSFLEIINVDCLQSALVENLQAVSEKNEESSWWQPSSATIYAGIDQCTDNQNVYWSLMIDQSNPDSWIIYIESFST